MPKPIRSYGDTSIFGGVFDEEFSRFSRRFFDYVKSGYIDLVVSSLVLQEIERALARVQGFFDAQSELIRTVDITEEALELRSASLRASILGERHRVDAFHVALATVHECRVIVSWNFRHIVNSQKIPLYNGVNLSAGYPPISIHSPAEVNYDDDEE